MVSFQRRKPPWKADGRAEPGAASHNVWVENVPWKPGSGSVEMPMESCREGSGENFRSVTLLYRVWLSASLT